MNKTLATIVMALLMCCSAFAQVCAHVESETPGTLMTAQPGGSVASVTSKDVTEVQALIVQQLKKDAGNTTSVVNPCPQTGESVALDVVVGQYRGSYIASLTITLLGKTDKDPTLFVSHNVLASSTKQTLAADVVFTFASLKLHMNLMQMGLESPKK